MKDLRGMALVKYLRETKPDNGSLEERKKEAIERLYRAGIVNENGEMRERIASWQ